MPPKKKIKAVHAQIENPVLVRKTILEGNILSIENLKLLKNIKQLKKRKSKLKTELKRLTREMTDDLLAFHEYLPQPEDIGITPEKQSEKEIKQTKREEERKRKTQEKLLVKTTKKEENPFEAKDEFDFDIEKLKAKINGL